MPSPATSDKTKQAHKFSADPASVGSAFMQRTAASLFFLGTALFRVKRQRLTCPGTPGNANENQWVSAFRGHPKKREQDSAAYEKWDIALLARLGNDVL
jgi:hypothetical protein